MSESLEDIVVMGNGPKDSVTRLANDSDLEYWISRIHEGAVPAEDHQEVRNSAFEHAANRHGEPLDPILRSQVFVAAYKKVKGLKRAD